MASTTQNFQTWKAEIDAYMQEEEALRPKSLYRQLFTVRSTNRLQLNEVTYSDAGVMAEVGELGDAVEDSDLEGYKTTYSRRIFRSKKTFSSDLMETDQTGAVERMARGLVSAPEYSRNMFVFSKIRNLTSSSGSYVQGDGKGLLSTLHPRKDGSGTQSNTFADAVQRPLDYAAVEELQDALLATVSNKGNLLNIGDPGRNKVIVTSPYNRVEAFKIAGVESVDEPDTAERNKNYFRYGDKFDVLLVPFINYEAARAMGETTVAKTSASNVWDTMWGIVDIDVIRKFWKVYEAEGYPRFLEKETESNEALVKYAHDKYAFGITTWEGSVWSLGDNSTLST